MVFKSKKFMLCLSAAFACAALASGFVALTAPRKLRYRGVIAEGQIRVLEPQAWVGHEFPQLPIKGLNDDLMTGRWSLVLCRDRFSASQAFRQHVPTSESRTAIVQLAPAADLRLPQLPGNMERGWLDDKIDWYCTTPVTVALEDGIVKSVNGSRQVVNLQPPLRVEDRLVDLGSVILYDKQYAELALTNTSGKTIELSAASSCGCTTAQIQDYRLTPGAKSRLGILYSPRRLAMDGDQLESIRIIVKDANDQATIDEIPVYVHAKVDPVLKIDPEFVDFGNVTNPLTDDKITVSVSGDSRKWDGGVFVDPSDKIRTTIGEASIEHNVCRTPLVLQVHPQLLSQGSDEASQKIVEILHVAAYVGDKKLRIKIPITGRVWRDRCYCRPAVCHIAQPPQGIPSTIIFTAVDTRAHPDWSSYKVSSNQVQIIDVRKEPINKHEMRCQVDFDISTHKDQSKIFVHMFNGHGDESVVPVSISVSP